MVNLTTYAGVPLPNLSGTDSRQRMLKYYDDIKAKALQETIRYRDWGGTREIEQSVLPLVVNPSRARIDYMLRMYMRATLVFIFFYPMVLLPLMDLYDYLITGSSLLNPVLSLLLLVWGAGTVTVSVFAMTYAFFHVKRLRRDIG
jgi:hypothetical protein